MFSSSEKSSKNEAGIGFEIFDDETDRWTSCPVSIGFDGQLNSAEHFTGKGSEFS